MVVLFSSSLVVLGGLYFVIDDFSVYLHMLVYLMLSRSVNIQ